MYSDVRKLVIEASNMSLREKANYPEELYAINAALWRIFFDHYNQKCLKEILSGKETEYWGPELSIEQINAIKSRIEGFRDTALEHGLLEHYDAATQTMDFVKQNGLLEQILSNVKILIDIIVIFFCVFLIIVNLSRDTYPLFLAILIGFWFSYSLFNESEKKLMFLKKQNDLVIRKVNQEFIKKQRLNFNARLIILGWVKSWIPENFRKSILENSKKYWRQWSYSSSNINSEKIHEKLSNFYHQVQTNSPHMAYELATILKILGNLDKITDNPFGDELELKERNEIRENWIIKLRPLIMRNADYSLMKKAEIINDLVRNVHFDPDRVFAYNIFLETEDYGCFVSQFIEWSKSDEGINRIAKFTVPSIIEIEALSEFIDEQIIFKYLSHKLILNSLQGLSGQRIQICEDSKNHYLDKRFSTNLETITGRRQIIEDLKKLHQVLMLYFKMMLDIMQFDNTLSWSQSCKQMKKHREIETQVRNLLEELSLIQSDN